MPAIRVSVSADDLRARVRHRLLNGAPDAPAVVWADDGAEVVVHVAQLDVRLTDGWLVVRVPLETRETGTADVRCVFFLGRDGRGDGMAASCTVDPRADPTLAGRWGETLLAAVWSGVQDLLEGALQAASAAFPKSAPGFVGYAAAEGSVRIVLSL